MGVLWYRMVYQYMSMRPRIDIDDDTRDRVRQYANAKGFNTERAYAELLHIGLKDADVEIDP